MVTQHSSRDVDFLGLAVVKLAILTDVATLHQKFEPHNGAGQWLPISFAMHEGISSIRGTRIVVLLSITIDLIAFSNIAIHQR